MRQGHRARRALIVDTDPGLDDALALAALCASPEADLRAAFAVGGNVPAGRAFGNLAALLRLFGRPDVPLARGRDARCGLRARHVHGHDGLAGYASSIGGPEWRPAPAPQSGSLLRKTLAAAPDGSLQVLCLGPLTNVAAWLRATPGLLARKVRNLVVMGGAIVEPGNVGPMVEFNIACDPRAAAAVLSGPLRVRLVPLDVTHRVALGAADAGRLARAGTEIGRALAHFLGASIAFQDSRARLDASGRPGGRGGYAYVHDAVAACAALRPELFAWRELPLAVAVRGAARGVVLSDRRPGRSAAPAGYCLAEAALGLDAPRVRGWIIERLARAAGLYSPAHRKAVAFAPGNATVGAPSEMLLLGHSAGPVRLGRCIREGLHA